MAQKNASELLAAQFYPGRILEKMAWINIIKNQPQTARIYLETLRKDLVYNHLAQTLLTALNKGFTPAQQAFIKRIQAWRIKDLIFKPSNESVDQILTRLLRQCPYNKMAFEYLISHYLLTRQVNKAMDTLIYLKYMNYPNIPTLYEEMILIYCGVTQQKLNLTRYPVSIKTRKRYANFVQLNNAFHQHRNPALLNKLITEFGRSYFFYFTFGQVGLK
jgi:hypothetical protein